jgi:hypothetical protein
MPVIAELQDIVDALGAYDRSYQERAVLYLLQILNHAEQDVADSHLTLAERATVRWERAMREHERRFGKASSDEVRKRIKKAKRDLDDT